MSDDALLGLLQELRMGADIPPEAHYTTAPSNGRLAATDQEAAEIVQQSFRTGNFRMIKDLGADKEGLGAMKTGGKIGLFQEFEYHPSVYAADRAVGAQERKLHKELVSSLHTGEFAVPGPGYKAPLTEEEKKWKDEEEQAIKAAAEEESVGAATMKRHNESLARRKWLQENVLKPFVPTGRSGTLQEVSRSYRQEILTSLVRILSDDWGDTCTFDGYFDEDDFIVFEFNVAELGEDRLGLEAYMDTLTQTHALISSNKLTKVMSLWNLAPDNGHIYFAFRPPWIKKRMT